MSGCAARLPCLTVAPKSVDLVMRFRAESTAVTPRRSGSQGATALATPIRHDRPAGPGPHPQAETVHAGTAPVIRLEGPLALCHDSLLAASDIVPGTVSPAGGSRSTPRRLDRLCVSLVTGAASGPSARIAAVSPTFGRLYEGTDPCSPGQTTPADRCARRRSFTVATPATEVRPIVPKRLRMLPNGWRGRGKLLASGGAVSHRNGAGQRSKDGGSAS